MGLSVPIDQMMHLLSLPAAAPYLIGNSRATVYVWNAVECKHSLLVNAYFFHTAALGWNASLAGDASRQLPHHTHSPRRFKKHVHYRVLSQQPKW